MSHRRPDPGDWDELPVPRAPRSPRLVVARHGAELEAAVFVIGVGALFGFSPSAGERVLLVVVIVLGLCVTEVRAMIREQVRRIRDVRRLQAAFLELGICSRHRRLTPSVLGSVALLDATKVRLWLPLGLTADHLARRRHDLADACLVDAVEIERHPGRVNTVDVILVHRQLGRRT